VGGPDKVYGETEGRVVGALEERSVCGGHCPCAWQAEQERCLPDIGSRWGIAPLPRRRAAGALRLEEREEISRGIAVGRSIRRIARDLGRSPSTVSREIRRNGGSQSYRASWADRRAWDRALRPNPVAGALCAATMARSPEAGVAMVAGQIAGWPEAAVPNRSRHATIARNDLSQPVRPDTRRLEEELRSFAYQTATASGQSGCPKSGLGHR